MIHTSLLVIAAIIFIANYLFTGWFIGYARENHITDIPTERSSHTRPTPRGGGVGFVFFGVLGVISYLILNGHIQSAAFIVLVASLVVISILGWLDDKYNLSRGIRFVFQSAAAVLVLVFVANMETISIPGIVDISVGAAGFVLGAFFIVAATNIYNFMDGVDGIASVQAFGVFAGWMVLSLLWAEPVLFGINFILLMTLLAFVLYNWAPAKIFMGDAGSLYLGFICASMPFLAVYQIDFLSIQDTIWYGAILLWPFLFDGTYTIFRRFLKGENIFEAHRSHLYQRLNIAGMSHSKIALLYLFFALFMILFLLLYLAVNDLTKFFLICLLTVSSFGYVFFVSKYESGVKGIIEPGNRQETT